MAPVIHFDYDFSPYGQKTKLVLKYAGVPFVKKDEPAVLPRPDLEALGITYRRIPLLAVGKDIYADSDLVISTILGPLGGKIHQTAADGAYNIWGKTVFDEILGLIPQAVLTPEFVKDRKDIFPFLTRPDLLSLRPSAVAQFHARLKQLENEILGGSSGPFINGSTVSLADIHVVWPVRWAFNNLGLSDADGAGKDKFPKVHRFLEAFEEPKPEVLSAEKAHEAILNSDYTATAPLTVAKDDAYGIVQGADVSVESFDSTPGSFPQKGKLVGTDVDQVVIAVDQIRLHFPRIGYIVRPQ